MHLARQKAFDHSSAPVYHGVSAPVCMHIAHCAALAAALLLGACGGGGGGAGPAPGDPVPPNPAPVVTAPRPTTQPLTTEVFVNGPAEFSVAAEGEGIRYQWQRDGLDLPGATAPSLILPQAGVADSGRHFRVVLSNAGGSVTSDAAALLVADKAWSKEQKLETNDSGGASHTQVAMDGIGNAFVVWSQRSAGRESVWVNQYSAAGAAWGTASLLEFDDITGTGSPAVAATAGGDAMVVWTQGAGDALMQSALFFADAAVWSSPIAVENPAALEGTADSDPVLTLDEAGNALALWVQQGPTGQRNLKAARFDRGTLKWEPAALIETADGAVREVSLQVRSDADGNAMALWVQSDGTRDDLWASRFDAATRTWGNAAQVEDVDDAVVGTPSLALQANGDAVVAWRQVNAGATVVKARRYTAASRAWGAEARLEPLAGAPGDPSAAIDANGNAMVIWNLSAPDASRSFHVRVARSPAGSQDWAAPRTLSSSRFPFNFPRGVSARIAFDGDGNATALYSSTPDPERGIQFIQAQRYYAVADDWGTAFKLDDSSTPHDKSTATLMMRSDGSGIATWNRFDDNNGASLYANNYRAP